MNHPHLSRATTVAVFFLLAAAILPAQTVDNQITKALLAIFPEISKGYIDLNANGKMDQTVEIDEMIPPSSENDSLLRAREILEFIIRNHQYIPSARLGDVVTALKNPQGAIPELLSLQYTQRMGLAMQDRADLEAGGLVFTPSALREAKSKVEGLISTLLAGYKKEGKEVEPDFVKARNDLFALMGSGYPLPDAMGQEDVDLLADIMINAVVREQKDSSTVKLAVVTLGKLKQSKAVPYLTDLLKVQTIRRDVIQALGEIGDKASLSVLLGELASESDASGKALIARALGVIGEKDAVGALEALLKAPDTASQPDTQRAVLGALVRISTASSPDAALQEIYRTNLASEDAQVRILAIRGLACAKNNAQAATRILETLKKESLDEVKVEAIAGLRKLQLSTLIQSLMGILQDPNSSESVKKASIEAISGSANAEQAVGLVSDQLASPSPVLRDAAASALLTMYASMPKPVVASLSRVTAVKATDETALTAATGVLARIADVSSIPSLTPLLASPFVEVKKNVTWALYRMKPSQNVTIVEEMKRISKSETEALQVRINAVRTLGAMRTDSAQLKVWDTLITILKMRGEKYVSLRLFAVKALGDLGNPQKDAVDALSRTAESNTDPQMVLEAVSALQKLSLQDPDVEAALLNVFKKTKDSETKVRVVEALGDIDSASTVDSAAEILRLDVGAPLKKRIVYALSQVGGQRELNAILDTVKDAALREYSEGVLEDANPAVLAAVVRKRMATETNKDVMDALDALNARIEGQ